MERPPASWPVVGTLLAVKAVVHLALVNRYGYHGDELYFIECGRHLDLGYVDHPPLVPWIAAGAGLFDHALWALRLPAIVAAVGTMALAAAMVRQWGGGRSAQLWTGLCLLFAPAYLRMGSMLDIPVVEVFFWTAASYLVSRILAGGDRRQWLLVGAVAGLGLLTKHSMLLWGFGLAVGLVLTPHRRELRSGWTWLGAFVALAIFAPNLYWQYQHGWPTHEFLSNMRRGILAEIPPHLFLAGQFLYMHPLSAPIWIAGLVTMLRQRSAAPRAFGFLYLAALAVLLITGGKPYYLAPAYPVLFAAGGVAAERFFARRRALSRGYAASYVVLGTAFSLLVLPVLPVPTVERGVGALLGWAVPPIALTHDLRAEHGWRAHAEAVERAYDALPARDRPHTTVVAASYSQASAVRFFGPDHLPPATSGHMSYHLWGPARPEAEVVIAHGLSRDWLEGQFDSVVEVDRVQAPLARPGDDDVAVYVCRAPRSTSTARWMQLRRYDNVGSHPTTAPIPSTLDRDAGR